MKTTSDFLERYFVRIVSLLALAALVAGWVVRLVQVR
jgi:hypothetical protein